ncbi:SRPBCC family protein [Lactiplantibacillus daowaiensis]|uniref:SRPBCC family protein n=1 Tax=Lactiplantibacillus daowaiensis TaxID=2559918 RepID=A0ABW1RYS1_9LACO|nr:SRPBCC family protein [Lactiplantibacillus daowaiensis]
MTTTVQPLFTNTITIDTTPEIVQAQLARVEQLPQWNPDISEITPNDDQSWTLIRTKEALNHQETFTLAKTADSVTYTSTGGRLAYQLVFTLEPTGTGTTVHEALYPKTDLLGLTLVAPIAKVAFYHNLELMRDLLLN